MWQRKNQIAEGELIIKKTELLKSIQQREGYPNVAKINNLLAEIDDLMEHEDLRWKQHAKEHWLKNGDKNSNFFHASVNQRRRANQITMILDEGEVMCSTEEEIAQAFTNYFQNLFTSSSPNGIEEFKAGLEGRVFEAMNEELIKDFMKEEFCATLTQMAPLKSPGPDSFLACFYQDNWPTIGVEVYKAISHFFNSGFMDEKVNYTHIALIPKKKNLTKVSEFRPISLCNVMYKIVSKTLANRLKIILPNIISSNQSAFIPGRLITDNVLAEYETLHSMHSRMWGKAGYMALKLNLSKAHDRVEWTFLEAVMRSMGFAEKWIGLIMTCYNAPKIN